MERKIYNLLILVLILFLPILAEAKLEINEIMYDLPGSDTGREWIEIKNSSSETVDLSTYRLKEANTNHKIESLSGLSTIPPNSFAVIADNPDKFKSDNPNYNGLIFDSSFSLSNTGETIEFVLDEESIDKVTYDNTLGAAGDGNSLSKVNDSFLVRSPTPGAENSAGSNEQITNVESVSEDTSDSVVNINKASSVFVPEVYANAGKDQTVMAGSVVYFSGVALGVKKEPLTNFRAVWNFGDGAIAEGKNVNHVYFYPGRYVASFDAASAEQSAGDTLVVNVLPASLIVKEEKSGNLGYVEIENKSNSDLNISGVIIETGAKRFILPKGTIIGGKNSIKFANRITNLEPNPNTKLLYQNGEEIVSDSVNNVKKSVNVVSEKSPEKTVVSIKKPNPAVLSDKVLADSERSYESPKNNNNSKSATPVYFLGTIAIVGLAGAAMFLQKKEKKSEADEYEIIEEVGD